MASLKDESVDLIVTSPPFGLVRKKDYGNVESHEYVEWFKPFGRGFRRVLKPLLSTSEEPGFRFDGRGARLACNDKRTGGF